MLAKEFLRHRKHLLPDRPDQVSRFFSIRTNAASLLNVAGQMTHLVQPGIKELGGRGRKADDHQRFPTSEVGIG